MEASKQERPIVLLGYMGSGKSTLLAPLANALNRKSIDLDAYIEDKEGKPISEIFEHYGDYYFRKLERESLQEVLELSNVVIALGGGAPCFYDSMKLINQKAFSVYLQVSEDVLSERLWNERSHRPLLSSLDETQFRKFIGTEIDKREIFYQKAKLTVRNLDVEESVEHIMKAVGRYKEILGGQKIL